MEDKTIRIIKPLVIVEDDLDMIMPNGVTLATHMAKKTELFVRKCYKSEGKMTEDSHLKILPAVFSTRRHTGIAEHRMVSVTFISDRGVSHESVRHRMAAFLQESTRYCDYSGKGNTYIMPPWVRESFQVGSGPALFTKEFSEFRDDLRLDNERYRKYKSKGWATEQVRYWLPQGVKTEYACSLNLGSWWNFFNKRTDPAAHPQMRQLAIPLLRYMKERLPQFYASIQWPTEWPGINKGFFKHKDVVYEEAKLVVNPFYDQVDFEEVYSE